MATIRAICQDALLELGVLAAGETLNAQDASLLLGKLHRLLDQWNAERAAVYADQVATYTLTPNLQPHTIGRSAATFSVSQRPVEILAANLIVDDVRIPLTVHGDGLAWWATVIDKETESDYPTDLGYETGWPNGSIYLYPEPAAAVTLELLTRVVLSAPALTDTFAMPPGYQEAITLTLAERSARAFGAPLSGDLVLEARRARALIFGNNDRTPPVSTADLGMPSGPGVWDWRNGSTRG